MTTTQNTKGQRFASTMRKNLGIGPRTRRHRDGLDLHTEILEAITRAAYYPGYYSAPREELFRSAFGAWMSHEKHIAGYRADALVIAYINNLTPYQFCGMLGRMVDAGVSNVGQGEAFYSNLRAEVWANAA